jgi:hypothetical protein
VPGPGIPFERPEVRDDVRPERVEVQVADQFEEIGLFLDHNRPVSVLEEMAHALVPPIEGTSVSREQTPHTFREGTTPGPH